MRHHESSPRSRRALVPQVLELPWRLPGPRVRPVPSVPGFLAVLPAPWVRRIPSLPSLPSAPRVLRVLRVLTIRQSPPDRVHLPARLAQPGPLRLWARLDPADPGALLVPPDQRRRSSRPVPPALEGPPVQPLRLVPPVPEVRPRRSLQPALPVPPVRSAQSCGRTA